MDDRPSTAGSTMTALVLSKSSRVAEQADWQQVRGMAPAECRLSGDAPAADPMEAWATPVGSRFNTTDLTAGGNSPQQLASLNLAAESPGEPLFNADSSATTAEQRPNKGSGKAAHQPAAASRYAAGISKMGENTSAGSPQPAERSTARSGSPAGEGRWNWASLRDSKGNGSTSKMPGSPGSMREANVHSNGASGTNERPKVQIQHPPQEHRAPTGQHRLAPLPHIQSSRQGPARSTSSKPDGGRHDVMTGAGDAVVSQVGSAKLSRYGSPPWRNAHNDDAPQHSSAGGASRPGVQADERGQADCTADVLEVGSCVQQLSMQLQGAKGKQSRQQAKEERWRQQLATPSALWTSPQACSRNTLTCACPEATSAAHFTSKSCDTDFMLKNTSLSSYSIHFVVVTEADGN